MSNCEYARDYYCVPACIGRRISQNGDEGIIVKDRGNYIGVNFDKDEPWEICNVHPTDNVAYLGIGKPRKISKSKLRYQEYLEVSDLYEGFRDFLRHGGRRER